MNPRHLFMDERLTGICVYCGAPHPDTRDHVPSRVLLDKPYPPQQPVVGACEKCNASFSLDEQYLACFIECVIRGTVEVAGLQRTKIRRILGDSPSLQHRIEACMRKDAAGNLLWQPEADRVRKIILKLARGHVAYELYPIFEEPFEVILAPLPVLSKEEQAAFALGGMTTGKLGLWPEIGSRAFSRALGKKPDHLDQQGEWLVVQPDRYRYAVVETGGVLVRMVLSEYLACAVYWN